MVPDRQNKLIRYIAGVMCGVLILGVALWLFVPGGPNRLGPPLSGILVVACTGIILLLARLGGAPPSITLWLVTFMALVGVALVLGTVLGYLPASWELWCWFFLAVGALIFVECWFRWHPASFQQKKLEQSRLALLVVVILFLYEIFVDVAHISEAIGPKSGGTARAPDRILDLSLSLAFHIVAVLVCFIEYRFVVLTMTLLRRESDRSTVEKPREEDD